MTTPGKTPCKYCGGDIEIRNPTGLCDHLHYPENVNKNYVEGISHKVKNDCDYCGEPYTVCNHGECPKCTAEHIAEQIRAQGVVESAKNLIDDIERHESAEIPIWLAMKLFDLKQALSDDGDE